MYIYNNNHGRRPVTVAVKVGRVRLMQRRSAALETSVEASVKPLSLFLSFSLFPPLALPRLTTFPLFRVPPPPISKRFTLIPPTLQFPPFFPGKTMHRATRNVLTKSSQPRGHERTSSRGVGRGNGGQRTDECLRLLPLLS